MEMIELQVKNMNQKSFYKKAMYRQETTETGVKKDLYSYDTYIMTIEKPFAFEAGKPFGESVITNMTTDENHLTNTTLKHIREFMQQNELDPLPKRKLVEIQEKIIEGEYNK